MRKYSVRPSLTLRGRTFEGARGWSPKPLHPPLTDVAIGAYLLGAGFDVASALGGSGHLWAGELWHAATFAFVAGAVASFPTALTGLADRQRSSRAGTQARRTINTRATIMVAATAVAVVDIAWRVAAYHDHDGTPIGLAALSGLTAVLVTLGATFGGNLVDDDGFDVETAGDHPAHHRSEVDVLPGDHDGRGAPA